MEGIKLGKSVLHQTEKVKLSIDKDQIIGQT